MNIPAKGTIQNTAPGVQAEKRRHETNIPCQKNKNYRTLSYILSHFEAFEEWLLLFSGSRWWNPSWWSQRTLQGHHSWQIWSACPDSPHDPKCPQNVAQRQQFLYVLMLAGSSQWYQQVLGHRRESGWSQDIPCAFAISRHSPLPIIKKITVLAPDKFLRVQADRGESSKFLVSETMWRANHCKCKASSNKYTTSYSRLFAHQILQVWGCCVALALQQNGGDPTGLHFVEISVLRASIKMMFTSSKGSIFRLLFIASNSNKLSCSSKLSFLMQSMLSRLNSKTYDAT